MADTCPACGGDANAMVALDMSDRWSDVFGKPLHLLFSNYAMIHVGGQQGV